MTDAHTAMWAWSACSVHGKHRFSDGAGRWGDIYTDDATLVRLAHRLQEARLLDPAPDTPGPPGPPAAAAAPAAVTGQGAIEAGTAAWRVDVDGVRGP